MIDLRNAVNKGAIPKTENPDEVRKDLELRVRTSEQILQRLPTAIGQVQASDSSKNLLNEICQIIYSLHQANKITVIKVYKNAMNSIKLWIVCLWILKIVKQLHVGYT